MGTVKTMWEDLGFADEDHGDGAEMEPIPLPAVKGSILAKVC